MQNTDIRLAFSSHGKLSRLSVTDGTDWTERKMRPGLAKAGKAGPARSHFRAIEPVSLGQAGF